MPKGNKFCPICSENNGPRSYCCKKCGHKFTFKPKKAQPPREGSGKVVLEDVLTALDKLPENYADVIIIDPPYNIGKDFGNNYDNLDLSDYLAWSNQWLQKCVKILKDSGTIYIYGFSEILAYIFVQIDLPKRWLVWHYMNKNVPSNKFWQRSHESIIVLWKSDKRIFNLDAVREPYSEIFLKNAAGKIRKSTKGRFSRNDRETVYQAHKNGALPRDVIKIAALAGGAGLKERFFYCKDCNDIYPKKVEHEHAGHNIVVHPTQKPIDLTFRLLKGAKPDDGGVVIIPFAGTGTELLAAKIIGMEALGFDVNPDYVNMANLLIEKGFPRSSNKPLSHYNVNGVPNENHGNSENIQQNPTTTFGEGAVSC